MEKKVLNSEHIEIINNFFSEKEHNIILNYCLNASYNYGESDNCNTPPVGMVHDIPKSNFVYELLRKKLRDNFSIISEMKLDQMYINCFSPSENPYFHTDGETGYTFLYYPQGNWKIDDGGETQFLIDESVHGVFPLPNRIVKFDASILHRATSFRDRHRFTVAIKYY
jgi:hypothetical protein